MCEKILFFWRFGVNLGPLFLGGGPIWHLFGTWGGTPRHYRGLKPTLRYRLTLGYRYYNEYVCFQAFNFINNPEAPIFINQTALICTIYYISIPGLCTAL